MAGTSKKTKGTKVGTSGRAAPAARQDWSPEALISAIVATSDEERIKTAKAAGILTKKGKLAQKYKSWGERVSMTTERKTK